MWRALSTDPIVLAGLALMLLVATPYLVPILSPGALEAYGNEYSGFPLIGFGIFAMLYRLRWIQDPRERRFWNLWVLSLTAWLIQQAIQALTQADSSDVPINLIEDLLLVCFYLFAVLAIEARPHHPRHPTENRQLASLRETAVVVFSFGLLIYFAVIPAHISQSFYQMLFPSFVIFIVLDAYLALRLGLILRQTMPLRWRLIYGWLLTTMILWLILDSLEMLLHARVLPWIAAGTRYDLLWLLPHLTLLLATRVREYMLFEPGYQSLGQSARLTDRFEPKLWGGPLVLYAVLFPLLHFSLYALIPFDPAMRRAHDICILALLVVLGALIWAYQANLESQNRKLEAERLRNVALIEHQAFHDPLTGLPNRRLLTDRLRQAQSVARRSRRKVALLFLDLDHFKQVNDSLGHAVGDALLQAVGRRVELQIRAGDTLARLGGDEFLVMVHGFGDAASAILVAEKILEAIREPFVLDGNELRITTSLGISLYPDDGDDTETLLRNADSAMYEAKRRGRNNYTLFSATGERFAQESS
ncbi:MAG TPA: GGDEF domain-containing protein [Acidobacteriota bacterium]